MKKLTLTLAILLGLTVCGQAQKGLFDRGFETQDGNTETTGSTPLLPSIHNSGEDMDANGEQVPIGSGVFVLAGLGAAYLVGKRRKE